MNATELAELRAAAEAAAEQMRTGPREWPGRPSAQRLALFLAASPDAVLRLIAAYESAAGSPRPARPATPIGRPHMNKIGYHSVYLDPIPVKPTDRWDGNGSAALVHDIMAGPLPAEYDGCDLLYADLPWRAGFAGYNTRAGVANGRTYAAFMAAVSGIIESAGRPTVLVTGRHAMRHLPPPAQTVAVAMPVQGQAAVALMFNMSVAAGTWSTVSELLDYLAGAYNRVGDFCCGYGWSARAFTRAGKTFVASDYNRECVGYIAAHADAWTAR